MVNEQRDIENRAPRCARSVDVDQEWGGEKQCGKRADRPRICAIAFGRIMRDR